MNQHKRKLTLLVSLLLLIICAAVICSKLLSKEESYQGRSWSPNHEYYMQKYRVFNVVQMPTMPGQGSDAIDGYIRIHDKNGKIIHERFYKFIRDTEAIWSGNKVILMSGGATEDNVLILPSSAE